LTVKFSIVHSAFKTDRWVFWSDEQWCRTSSLTWVIKKWSRSYSTEISTETAAAVSMRIRNN